MGVGVWVGRGVGEGVGVGVVVDVTAGEGAAGSGPIVPLAGETGSPVEAWEEGGR